MNYKAVQMNYSVIDLVQKKYLIDVDVKNRTVKRCICIFVILTLRINDQRKKKAIIYNYIPLFHIFKLCTVSFNAHLDPRLKFKRHALEH